MNGMAAGEPWRNSKNEACCRQICFLPGAFPIGRRLNAADGSFDGVVIVMVGAGYFVSGYETAKLGEHGVLAIVGIDGVVRVRRSGEVVFAGDAVNYGTAISTIAGVDSAPTISANSWDGVKRWTNARELYGFPLAILVGLSVDEQLAGAQREARTYWWR